MSDVGFMDRLARRLALAIARGSPAGFVFSVFLAVVAAQLVDAYTAPCPACRYPVEREAPYCPSCYAKLRWLPQVV